MCRYLKDGGKFFGRNYWFVGAAFALLVLAPWVVAADGTYSWVQLVSSGKNAEGLYEAKAVARVIVEQEGLSCEDEVVIALQDGTELALSTREKPKSGVFFGITVCQIVIPREHSKEATMARILLDGAEVAALPIPNLSHGVPVSTIINFGDTGCRINHKQPDCDPNKDWPFPTLIERAVSTYTGNGKPVPLVLHTGDYRYAHYNRAGLDMWEHEHAKGGWNPEFFKPAKDLLSRAHWIFLRGNHESCHETSEAGPGWLYFFDFNIDQRRFCTDLPGNLNNDEAGYLESFALDLLPAGASTKEVVRLVSLDSVHRIHNKQVFDGKGKVKKPYEYEAAVKYKNIYTDRFNQIAPFLADDVPVWITTHMPLFVVNRKYNESKYELPLPRDALFDSVLVVGDTPPIEKVPVVLSSHVHRAQLVDPTVSDPEVQDIRRPMEYIIGNSGVNLSGEFHHLTWAEVDATWVRLPSSKNDKRNVIEETWRIQQGKMFGFLTVSFAPQKPSGYEATFHVTFYDIKKGWQDDSFVDCTINSSEPYKMVCPDTVRKA